MKINTRYQIGDEVYVFLENKLQKIKIKSIYAHSFTVYRVEDAKENVIVVE